jgi:hypothetical protein
MAEAILMFGGMIAGGLVNTVNDSFANVEDTCRALNDAQQKLSDMTNKWKNILTTEAKASAQLESFHESITTQGQMIAATSVGLKETFRQKKEASILGFSIAIFIMTLSLLFKYFNVFPNIWNYIVNK